MLKGSSQGTRSAPGVPARLGRLRLSDVTVSRLLKLLEKLRALLRAHLIDGRCSFLERGLLDCAANIWLPGFHRFLNLRMSTALLDVAANERLQRDHNTPGSVSSDDL